MAINETTAVLDPESPPHGRSEPGRPDLSGRSRVLRNVMTSWATHFAFIVGGFLMPRLIDRSVGQATLGVWDFGWSLVSYLGLAQLGIGSSVNRYVAKYRAAGDQGATNAMVSSVVAVQCVVATFVLLLSIVLSWYAPLLARGELASHGAEIRIVMLCLGAGLAVQMLFNPAVGVMTGCHRWDLHNFLNASGYGGSVVFGASALLLGRGLRGLAVSYFCVTVAVEIVRVVLARRVCPELRISFRLAGWQHAKAALFYGLKTVLNSLARVLLYQTNSILIAGFLGPASVALFSRPKALVSHAQTLVNKFALVLTPTASSMHATGQMAELRRFLVNTSRFAVYLALPMVLFLAIMADPILELWMGPRYRHGVLLVILALGHLSEMTRQPAVNILAGMNRHGRVAMISVVTAAVSVGLGYLMLGVMHWGLVGAALAIGIPLAVMNGTIIPVYTCRQMGMPLREYLRSTSTGPVLCNLPFAAVLLVARLSLPGQPLLQVLVGAAGGGVLLSVLYWRWVLPVQLRLRLALAFAPFGRKLLPCQAETVDPERLRA